MRNPQYETYHYVGEICRLKSQSIVECRLPGSEISSILAVHARAVTGDTSCGDGEVSYGGKVFLCIVYEDGDKKICRAERGAEFYHKAEGNAVTPACFVKTGLVCENVSWRREGSGLYISVVVGAEHTVYGSKTMEYLSGGEDLIVKKGAARVCRTVCVSGETEGEDEFNTDYVGDILMHSETAVVNRAYALNGEIHVEGEMNLNVCVLKADESVCSYERLLPFRITVPCEDAYGQVVAGAKVAVRASHLEANANEEKGNSRILFTYTLSAECYLSICEEISVIEDAFSTAVETTCKKSKDGGIYLMNTSKCVERISGDAVLSPTVEGEYALQAAVLPRAEITCRKGEKGMEAEGAILAEVLLVGADGAKRSANLTLPFVFPLDIEGENVEAECMVCGLNVRRKKSGETEAEATLKLSLRVYEAREWEYVAEVKAGEEKAEEDGSFSIFCTNAGEGLWEVAKRLSCSPEDLKRSNPDLEFPLKDGARIYVYRQIPEEV